MKDCNNYFERDMETIKKMNQVMIIISEYKIVENEKTIILKHCMENIQNIEKGYTSLLDMFDMDSQDIITLCNLNIIKYLNECFNFYSKEYNIPMDSTNWGGHNSEFGSEYRIMKTIENNLGKIATNTKSTLI